MSLNTDLQDIILAELERLTIIMLGELAAAGKAAVAGGGYRSTSDVIREALHGEVTG